MKLCYAFMIVVESFLICGNLVAQNIQNSEKISSNYDRNSITTFFLRINGENNASKVESKIGLVQRNEKFNDNDLNEKIFGLTHSRSQLALNPETTIEAQLNRYNVGKLIISKWFNRQSDGTMDMELIFERGLFNATDASYIKSKSTKRGNSLLKDYGERLINRSYILVLDYSNIKTAQESNLDDYHGWSCNVNGYLFKVDFNEEIRSQIYDCWIYEEDSPDIIASKNARFEKLKVNVSFVNKVMVRASGLQANPNTNLGKFMVQKSDDVLLGEMVQKGYDESIYALERKIEDFMVKTSIYSVKPIKAKIGKKEGLSCDDRYFAYEYVYSEKLKSNKTVRRGVIRATSQIVDNRHVAKGGMETSKFYQTAGRRLEEGFLLRQQNDLGIEVWGFSELGDVGGIGVRLDYRLGRMLNIKSLFIFGELGLQIKDYGSSLNNISFLHYSVGLAKGVQLMRNLELRPYASLGYEVASGDDIETITINDITSIKTLSLKVGANLALNLTYWMQITAGIGNYSFIGNATDKNDVEYKTWSELFENRKGLSPMLGVKFMF